MTTRAREEVAKSAGSIKDGHDRCTVLFQVHYLEFATGDTTDVRWGYDRLVSAESSPYSATLRVNPGKETQIIIPVQGPCEILLGHKTPEMIGDDKLMKEQLSKNVVEVYHEGKLLGQIKPDRIMFGEFKGSLIVKATHATAILHVTATPC